MYKNEIEILANPGLEKSGIEQPGSVDGRNLQINDCFYKCRRLRCWATDFMINCPSNWKSLMSNAAAFVSWKHAVAFDWYTDFYS